MKKKLKPKGIYVMFYPFITSALEFEFEHTNEFSDNSFLQLFCPAVDSSNWIVIVVNTLVCIKFMHEAAINT